MTVHFEPAPLPARRKTPPDTPASLDGASTAFSQPLDFNELASFVRQKEDKQHG
jgi:hypothetical protein